MTRRARVIATVAALIALQLVTVVVYRFVQRRRQQPAEAAFVFEKLAAAERAPRLRAQRHDGNEGMVAWPTSRHRLVHFWATWCEPCRRELPALLAFARATPRLELVAIAIEDDWGDLAAFFAEVAGDDDGGDGADGAGGVPPEVLLSRDTAYKRLGVSTLPDSYLVAPDGQLLERYHGARDWGGEAARAHVRGAIE